ncbi:MAG TPA: prolyl oligopeptidase family serine peptidase [Acidimicrobiales bacterium]|nr:prolyl oligopeptidase family serine peptidase [Acidimicrobiales bacterium]
MQPYGSWPTPITSELVVRAAAGLGGVAVDGDDVWWSESRPDEGGRTQLVRWRPGAGAQDVLPDGANARTAVHEYGGGAWHVAGGRLWYADWSDQRLHHMAAAGDGFTEPTPVTPGPEVPRGDRWADADLDPDGRWLVLVREHHGPGATPAQVVNEVVVVDTAGEVPPRPLVSGPDFVSDPRLSPDRSKLCWLQWNHPDMPWDGTELVVSDLRWSSIGPGLMHPEVMAGRPTHGGAAPGESVSEPRWAPDGSLWFISDRNGWWNLHRWTADGTRLGRVDAVAPMEAEVGLPQWVFGSSRYAFLPGGRVAFAYQRDGLDHLAVRAADGIVSDLDLPYTSVASVKAAGEDLLFIGATATAEPAVVRVRLSGATVVGDPELLRPPRDLGLDPSWFSVPEAISFPTSGGRVAHALVYAPTNPDVPAEAELLPDAAGTEVADAADAGAGAAGAGDAEIADGDVADAEIVPGDGPSAPVVPAEPDLERPPLLVFIHGGPTAAARPMLQLGIQYWTSRGITVVDVNYGGSTGYGRAYRDELRGAWGVVDLDDCLAAAEYLAGQGRVDRDRLWIRGGSAGGYTTLAALAFRDTFAAGASHFGVADLAALAADTHKFESRYLDGLIGPYPARADLYRERSPIHHVEGFDVPLAVFQGLEDEVVPPEQSEMIVAALRTRGVPVAYVAFEGEQHGFRQAANIRRALDGELSFYAQVFGFALPPDEGIEPIEVENLA